MTTITSVKFGPGENDFFLFGLTRDPDAPADTNDRFIDVFNRMAATEAGREGLARAATIQQQRFARRAAGDLSVEPVMLIRANSDQVDQRNDIGNRVVSGIYQSTGTEEMIINLDFLDTGSDPRRFETVDDRFNGRSGTGEYNLMRVMAHEFAHFALQKGDPTEPAFVRLSCERSTERLAGPVQRMENNIVRQDAQNRTGAIVPIYEIREKDRPEVPQDDLESLYAGDRFSY